jgi:hypothetical protein
MNDFHHLNLFTQQGDKNSALLLLKNKNEFAVKKIMKKAGYTLPSLQGKQFWLYVQNTIISACRNKKTGDNYRNSY